MTNLADLEDVDLTSVELADGTPLAATWRPGRGSSGVWVAQEALPASAVEVQLDPMPNRWVPDGFHPRSSTVQEAFTSLYRNGFHTFRKVTDADPDLPVQARSCLFTDYRRSLEFDQHGGTGAVFGLTYGAPGDPAGGFVNVTAIAVEVRASEDPRNEIGGCIASLQLGRGGDPPPTASLWGSSYTLRGSVGRQPGGLMAYTAVVQNYFDGSVRSDNYGYAAVTRPGIGDGADFHVHDPIRHATTYPVDLGFVVCGDSGPYPQGGELGFRVAFQAGGAASPWAERDQWRSRIGTGLVVRDWFDGGVHVHPPHPDAEPGPQVRLDRRDGQRANFLECRSQDGLGLMAAIGPDGRMRVADGRDPSDAVTVAQLEAALASVRSAATGGQGPASPGIEAWRTRELTIEVAARARRAVVRGARRLLGRTPRP